MKNSYLLLLIPLAALILLSGCTTPPWCGDGSCNGNEDQYNCPEDCGAPPGKIIEIRDNEVFPYDSTQTINPMWKAYLSSDERGITSITIKNNWGFNQVKTETVSSKLLLGKGYRIGSLFGYLDLEYTGLNTDLTHSFIIGEEQLAFDDIKGVRRTIPLVIPLGTGTNTFEISGNTYLIDINSEFNKARYWENPTAVPAGTGYKEVTIFDKNVNTIQLITFIVDADTTQPRYYLASDKTTSQYWLLLAAQSFGMINANLAFERTALTDTDSKNYYLPDQSTYNVLTNAGFSKSPTDGDLYSFTGVYSLSDGEQTNIYTNTSTALLVNSNDGKIRLADADNEVENPNFNLNEYATAVSLGLMQGYSLYGTKFNVDGGLLSAYVPENQLMAGISFTSTNSELSSKTQMPIGSPSSSAGVYTFGPVSSPEQTYTLASKAFVQTIADGWNAGEVVLQINPSDYTFTTTYDGPINPIELGTDTGRGITFFGKKYLVREATATRLVLETA